tara:strand:- start:725 stop:1036 length:312 start_codon:yes stop_codon:yes gene_type:complete
MDLLIDLMPEENLAFDIVYERGKTNEYYQGMAEHTLKQLDTTEHYFHFVKTILKNYHTLTNEQKQSIVTMLDVKPIVKTVIKEKIVYKEKKVKKAQLNTYDDY